MSAFRPLFSRGKRDPVVDVLQSGIPAYLQEPVRDWLRDVLWSEGSAYRGPGPREGLLRSMQMILRLDPPLNWRGGAETALGSVLSGTEGDEEFGLTVVDFLLRFQASKEQVDRMSAYLRMAGSEWEISPIHGAEGYQLTQRSLGPVKESIEELQTDSQRAHHHLMTAWSNLVGRKPNPSTAYREAVRAVEAVAKPVVSPKNKKATLGTIIRDLRSKPEKWEVALDKATASDVADMADLLWTSQLDRHGTDDEQTPLTVSPDEADAAVHIAIGLTRMFSGKLIRPV
jgi:hypothetical protein